MESIIQAIEGHEWQTMTGLLLLALTALVRDVTTRAQVTGLAAKAISAVSSYLSGVAVLLPVTTEWWHAVLIALGTPLASQGLRDLLVDLVRWVAKRKATTAIFIMLAIPTISGCSTHRAQIAVQTSLTGLAEGVVAADRVVAAGAEEAADGAIERARDRCAGSCSDPLALYREEMAPWYLAVQGLDAAAVSLRLLQDGIDIWVDSGTLPDGIGAVCLDAGEAVEDLLELLEVAGVDVPSALDGAPGVTSAMCALIAERVARQGGNR